jgi:hypothetical protein
MVLSTSPESPPLRQWWIGVRLGVALAGLGLLIRIAGFRRAVRIAWWIADRLPDAPSETRGPVALAEARAREIAAVASRMPVALTCLPQSLLLATLMRRRGMAGELCIGAQISGTFDAHAWIEIDGAAIHQPADVRQRYRVLLRVPTVSA